MSTITPAFLSLSDVCSMTSLSRTAVMRLILADKFPPKVDLGTGRRFAFNRAEVLEWIEKRLAAAPASNWREAA
jgi:prophage regulatory protein